MAKRKSEPQHNTADGLPPVDLYPFQKQYLAGLPPKYIFAADTGTGKTIMALAHYDKHAYLKPLLILAPASKVNTKDWDRDVAQYFQGRIPPYYEVWSYEKFSRNAGQKHWKELGALNQYGRWLKDHPDGDYAVIADEVHKAKNPQSGIGKAVFAVATPAKFFVGLSATPLPNAWQDAANYFKIFGYVKNKTEFWKTYVRETNVKGFPEILGYNQEDRLQNMWNRVAKPLAKKQALDLAPITYIPVDLPPGPGYAKVQQERISEGRFLDNPSALLHALRQSVLLPKLKWLDDFLEGVSDNTVVFYNYRSERDMILEMLKQKKFKGRKVFRQDGDVHGLPGKPEWAGLQRSITLAQYQSGATGVEMTYASTTVYFSPTYSYQDYEQSIGRTYRNGQLNKVTLYLLRAPATVERDIWRALANKSNFQEKQWYEQNYLA